MTLIFLKPIITVFLIAILSGLLGVFVQWKKIAYFGDAISHSMLLAVVISAFIKINHNFILFSFAIIFSLICGFILNSKIFSRDSLVMILSYCSISLAIILSDIFLPSFNFVNYLFGDLMMVSNLEIAILSIMTIIVIIFSFANYQKILLINIDSDLAKIEKINVNLINVTFIGLLILTISIAVQVVGVFLITALLILPATISRVFAKNPLQSLIYSLLIAVFFSLSSFKIAENYNLTISATIVLVMIVVFIITLILKSLIEFFNQQKFKYEK
jgi:zinc transport system permease protein